MHHPTPADRSPFRDVRPILRLGLPLLIGNLSTAGMMLAATFTLFRAQGGDWLGIGMGLLTTFVAIATRINAMVMLLVGAALFLIRG